MLGLGRKALERKVVAQLRGMPRIQRSERLRTMRWYRRQYMAQQLRKARLELAARKLAPPLILFTLLAAAAGAVLGHLLLGS